MASFTLLAAPYVTFLSIHAGHLRIESKSALNAAIAARMHRGLSYTAAGDAIDDRLNEVGPELDEGYFFSGAVPAGTWRERTSVAFDAARRHLVEIPRLLKTKSYGTPLLLLAVAIGLASGPWTRRRRVLELGVVCYVLGLFAALSSVYHFWDRYADGFIPVLAIWGGYGLERLRVFANAGLARLRTRFQVDGYAVAAGATIGAIAILFTLRINDSATLTERVAGERLRPYAVRSDRVFSISAQSVYYADATWLMLPYTVHAQTALAYVREKHPQWLILDREYAGERPYVLEWLRTGIPDTHARLIATVGDPRHPDAAVYRWSAHL